MLEAGALGGHDTTGQHEWPSAVVLKAFLRRYPGLVHGRRVLEVGGWPLRSPLPFLPPRAHTGDRQLGSGLGTCGMVAAELGAAEVVFTDAQEARPVLAHLARSVQRDKSPSLSEGESGHRCPCHVRGFTWGCLPSFLMDPGTCPPQVVLAADCLYDSSRTSLVSPQPCVVGVH